MGKSAIIYVMGLSLIIGIALANINDRSLGSMDSYTLYFGRTMAHNIALAGANVGTNLVLFDPSYSTPITGSFSGGAYRVTYHDTGSFANYSKFMSVVAAYNSGGVVIRDTVKAVFQRVMLSQYVWFTEREENGYWRPNGAKGPYFGGSDWKITGDSIFGPAHTNYKFNLAGQPYFRDKVTATLAPTLMNLFGKKDPIYNQGYEWGVTINRDTANIGALRTLSNAGSPFAALMNGADVGLEFFPTGNVRLRIPWNTGSTLDTVVSQSILSSTKVIGVYAGDLHIKGTYSGQVTVAAFQGTTAAEQLKGNVWIEGDIVAANSPRTNPSSTDMMGIIAERMGYIAKDPSRTSASVLYIDAAIYCHNGEFTAEEFWNMPKSGRVSLFGALVQKTAGSLGVFTAAGLQNGMYYSLFHDPRFRRFGPPAFPFSSKLKLVAWWEN